MTAMSTMQKAGRILQQIADGMMDNMNLWILSARPLCELECPLSHSDTIQLALNATFIATIF